MSETLESTSPETAELVAVLESQLRRDYAAPAIKRDAHPKMHGCVQAELLVDPDIPAELRHGVFAEASRPGFRAWVRFSNAFRVEHDLRLDTRGMGIKLLGVPGEKLSDDEHGTQDFLLATHDAFFLPNPRGYAEFAEAVGEPRSDPKQFFRRHRIKRGNRALLRSALVLARNPLAIPYFSQTPYQLGPHVVKLHARPCLTRSLRQSLPAGWWFWIEALAATALLKLTDGRRSKPAAENFCDRTLEPRNLLRLAMMAFLSTHDASFELCVQARKDPDRMPIDDATVSWSQDASPFRRVATLRIPRQVFWPEPGLSKQVEEYAKRMVELGENMSFNPWHALPEHRPLGAINAVRREVYLAISEFRHHMNGVPRQEPTTGEFDEIAQNVR